MDKKPSAFVSQPFENEQFRTLANFYFIDNQLFTDWHQHWHRPTKYECYEY
ncbi:MAG: hypothetical protein JWP37_4108 [Mucilaginibacter sp.]|nr:hypothetical protein [Mucilaginibacter sp.]